MNCSQEYQHPLPHRMRQGVLYVEGFYEVTLGNNPAGKVQISKQGLYCRVVCHCIVPKDMVYRLYAAVGEKRGNLGVVVPNDSGYLLDRKIPAKQLEGCSGFLLSAKSEKETGQFIPIHPSEPFSYIRDLESAFMEIQDGKIGIRLKENSGAV